MRTVSVILVTIALMVVGAGCSSDKTGSSTSAQDWKKQAPPASYLEQAKAHNAAASPAGGQVQAPAGQPASTP